MILPDEELLRVWDATRSVPPAMQAAALLDILTGSEDAAQLPIGVRDRHLLALRDEWRNSAFESVIACPECAALVELSFNTPTLSETVAATSLAMNGTTIELRLPDSRDLAAVGSSSSIDDARANLAARCIVRATRLGEEVPPPALDDAAIAAISGAMAAADPDGDLRIAVVCPDCAHSWDVLFDPATYVWNELETAAIGAMREVDALASAYGWTEEQILAIPSSRRRIYLGMVLG
ncbi:MAG TPA: hypothetical protein VHX14_00015 [Thermoanaerobaculia bacterium]|jgi:hypothetical protein|nr:hypothetical protein [Thermoanaerobaculia bacterium]